MSIQFAKLVARQPYKNATYMDLFLISHFVQRQQIVPNQALLVASALDTEEVALLKGSRKFKNRPDASKNSLKPGPALLSAVGIVFHTNNAAIW